MSGQAVVDSKSKSYYIINKRNVLAVGVMWAVFVVCLAIINVVVVAQPQWLGDTSASPGVGFFGLVRRCQLYQSGSSLVCVGRLDDFSTLLNDSFRAATVFSGLAALLTLATIVLLILFFFVTHTEWVFRLCGGILGVTCLFSFLGCVIFPAGWDDPSVQSVCGSSAGKFNTGTCSIRWAFVLAIISIFDSLVLAILAFVLGAQLQKLQPVPDTSVSKPRSKFSEENMDVTDQRSHGANGKTDLTSGIADSPYHSGGYHNWGGDNFTDVSVTSVARSTRSRNFQL